MPTTDMFAEAVRDVADGPQLSSFMNMTGALLRRLSEKGLTLEQCTDRKMLNRSRRTLEAHCRQFEIAFPDYTPVSMRPKGWRKAPNDGK